jgi:hypothetical protein
MTKRSASGKFASASSTADAEMTDDEPATAKKWRKALEISEAQLAAGQTVDGRDVLRRLDESIARLEANKAAARRR